MKSQVFAFSVYVSTAVLARPSTLRDASRLLHDAAVLNGVFLRVERLDGLGLLHLVLAEDELDAVAEEALGLTEGQAEVAAPRQHDVRRSEVAVRCIDELSD